MMKQLIFIVTLFFISGTLSAQSVDSDLDLLIKKTVKFSPVLKTLTFKEKISLEIAKQV